MIDWSQAETTPREYDKLFDDAYAASVAYLKETDWQVIAMIERQRQMPDDVVTGRLEALEVVMSV